MSESSRVEEYPYFLLPERPDEDCHCCLRHPPNKATRWVVIVKEPGIPDPVERELIAVCDEHLPGPMLYYEYRDKMRRSAVTLRELKKET